MRPHRVPVNSARWQSRRNRAAAALAALVALLALAPSAAPAQQPDPPAKLAREGYRLSAKDAENLEAWLKANPEDLATRAKLLGFYFRAAPGTLGREAAIEARRRHILWLIEHHPESEAAALSEATIDRAGHGLADAPGYGQASELWIAQAKRHAQNAKVVGQAARFFQVADKGRAVALLLQGKQIEPGNPEWSARLGYVYAIAILGVDLINQNGLPTSHNPAQAGSDFAKGAADELRK